MIKNVILNKKDSLIAHYFPNERIPKGCSSNYGIIDYPGDDSPLDVLEKYCKKVWEWEANIGNRSRFIFKHCCIPN